MNIMNERINHITFGEGTVISQNKSIIAVEFNEQYGVKQFLYPDAFEEFLKLSNSDMEVSVIGELNEKKTTIETLRLQKINEREAERIRALESLKAQKKKSTAKSTTTRLKSKTNE